MSPPSSALQRAIDAIGQELDEQLARLEARRKVLEAARLRQRTKLRHGDAARGPAAAPASRTTAATSMPAKPATRHGVLLDYLPEDYLLVVDESHVHAAPGARNAGR